MKVEDHAIAKFGIPKESRRAMGYHAAPGDKVMETYGRDDMAAPLPWHATTTAQPKPSGSDVPNASAWRH